MGPRSPREVEGLEGGALHSRPHEGTRVEPPFHRLDLLAPEAGGRMGGGEERAAVGIRLDGGLERIEPLRGFRDLDLVHADQGRSTGMVAASSIRARLWSVCEA